MIPTTTILPDDPAAMRLKLTDDYQSMANAVNGRLEKWTPTVYGSSTVGAPTYTTQEGWYCTQGIMADVWFNVVWNAVGGAVGSIYMDLPVISQVATDNIWVTGLLTTGLSFSGSYHYATLVLTQNSQVATVIEGGSGQTLQGLTFAQAGTGGFQGHMRYIMKRDLSKR